ncbi:MAG TPA: hypothetical protein VFL59_01625, partial [Candidatus Nanopelagicales bacterium]|nr:hypothetical protein [Candidatus Nanopelagicales bacterium]
DCPICGATLEAQTWANRAWVDCASMHRLTVTPQRWDELCRQQLVAEVRQYLAGMPPIPGLDDEG